MQISNEEINRLLALGPQARTGTVRNAGATPAGVEGRSNQGAAADVEVSAISQDVQHVQKVLKQVPEVREDRVQALKAQIESGTYKVSGENIADLIIRRSLADNAAL